MVLYSDESHFFKAAQVTLGLAEFGGQEGLDEIPSYGRSYGPAAHAENVQMIVLDSLPSRVMVVDECSANAWNLIGADRCAHSTPADRYAAIHLALGDSPGEGDDHIRIVVVWT
jgi:hypothetical protein